MHLTDGQLNEYLDNESTLRTQIESHVSTCGECAARLTALISLFAELDSLPEMELTHNLAARFVSSPGLPASQPSAWLILTATLQAAVALIALILAAPFVTNLLPTVQTPSFPDVFLQMQSQWTAWLGVLSTFHMPTLPQLPALDISSLMFTLTLAGVSVLWLVGNGLFLRKQFK